MECTLCRGKIKKDKEIEVKINNKIKYFCDWECLKIYAEEMLSGVGTK